MQEDDLEMEEEISQEYTHMVLSDNVIERIHTFDDILVEIGKTYQQVIPWAQPSCKMQLSQNANAKIQAITEAYNEGVAMDFTNREQLKYYLYFERQARGGWVLGGVSDHHCAAALGAGSYFKSRELAQDAYKKFKDIWDDYLPE